MNSVDYVTIEARYYDEVERKAFANTGHGQLIDNIVGKSIALDRDEFIANGLLREQKLNRDGWRTKADLRKKVASRWSTLSDYFEVLPDGVRATFIDQDESEKAQTETIGVAAAISLLDIAFDGTQADWTKVPVSNDKDLDFERFSDGQRFIMVEAKGRLVGNTELKSGLSDAKSDIKRKKASKQALQRASAAQSSALIGVITAISDRANQHAISYLVDPPFVGPVEDPRKYRLLARLSFYYINLSLISRSPLLQGLAQRIRDIAALEDYAGLSSLPLVSRNGAAMSFPPSFDKTLSHDEKRGFFGEVIAIRTRNNRRSLFFFGFLDETVRLIVAQDFQAIETFRAAKRVSMSQPSEFRARVATRELKFADIAYDPASVERDGRVSLRVRGQIGSSSSGFVFGEIRLTK